MGTWINVEYEILNSPLFSLQYHHSVGEGPWKRCLRAHHQAVPQRSRVHSQRQLRHLQCLWEDLGRRPAGADREAQCGCPAGCPTRLGKPSWYGFEGASSRRTTCLSIRNLKWVSTLTFPFMSQLSFLTSVRFWRSWVRSLAQWRILKVLRFSPLTSESYKEMELISTRCKRYGLMLFIDALF